MDRSADTLDGFPAAFPEAVLVPIGEYACKPPILVGRVATLIGSGLEATLRLRSRSVSRRHALLVNSCRRLLLRDLGSRTGVMVNDQPVRQAVLADGDRIRLGRVEFSLEIGAAAVDAGGPAAPPARIRLWPEATRAIAAPLFLIGRQHDCDLQLPEAEVARVHVAIFPAGTRWLIAHLPARSRTSLNGTDIAIAELRDGDQIQVVGHKLAFETIVPAADAEAPAIVVRHTPHPTVQHGDPFSISSPTSSDDSALSQTLADEPLTESSLSGEVLPAAPQLNEARRAVHHRPPPVVTVRPPPVAERLAPETAKPAQVAAPLVDPHPNQAGQPESQPRVRPAVPSPAPAIPDWIRDAGAVAFAVASSNLPVAPDGIPELPSPPPPRRWKLGTLVIAAVVIVGGVAAWRWPLFTP